MAELQPKKLAAQWMIVGDGGVTHGSLDALARSQFPTPWPLIWMRSLSFVFRYI
jgi:hypothetical protein